MNVAYVNPFVQGAQKVIANVCSETPKLGKVFLKSQPYVLMPVSVAVEIKGAFAGEVVYTMEEPLACHIASQMMGGMPVAALDDISQSAVAELGNMISGNVATIFSGQELLVDISPPKFKKDAASGDFTFAAQVQNTVCVPLTFENGLVFEVDVMIP